MRIEQSDIDALITIVTWLKAASEMPDYCESKLHFLQLSQHARKVYILLLNATERGQLELKRLCEDGRPDFTDMAGAIRVLCPDINHG